MIKTYERTMFIENLTDAKVRVLIHENSKYSKNSGEVNEITFTGLKSWSIVTEEEAKKIEEATDGSCIDENHEYLVLDFVDGRTVTFRNSFVDMFIR